MDETPAAFRLVSQGPPGQAGWDRERHQRAGQGKQGGGLERKGEAGRKSELSLPSAEKSMVWSVARSKGRRAVARVCSWMASPAGVANAEAVCGRRTSVPAVSRGEGWSGGP